MRAEERNVGSCQGLISRHDTGPQAPASATVDQPTPPRGHSMHQIAGGGRGSRAHAVDGFPAMHTMEGQVLWGGTQVSVSQFQSVVRTWNGSWQQDTGSQYDMKALRLCRDCQAPCFPRSPRIIGMHNIRSCCCGSSMLNFGRRLGGQRHPGSSRTGDIATESSSRHCSQMRQIDSLEHSTEQ
jgi:hypothetical protein